MHLIHVLPDGSAASPHGIDDNHKVTSGEEQELRELDTQPPVTVIVGKAGQLLTLKGIYVHWNLPLPTILETASSYFSDEKYRINRH